MNHHPLVEAGAYASLQQLMLLEQRVRGLTFMTRQPVASILSGGHAARLRGRGLSFDELRPYNPGDDLRRLDWRAFLRYGKPFVRSYTEERDRPTLLVVDQRMSLFFGSQLNFKSVTAAELAAIGAWMALQAGDRVGGLIFTDRQIEQIAPLRSRGRVEALCAAIVRHNHALNAKQLEDESPGQLDAVLRRCLSIAKHDHLLVIISDFAGLSEQSLRLLRQLREHNDVLALQVFDPLALQIPQVGRIRLAHGSQQVDLDMSKHQVRQPLEAFFSGRLKEVAKLLQRSQVPLMVFNTRLDTLDQMRNELNRLSMAPR